MLDAGIWEVVINIGPGLADEVVAVLEDFESMGVSVEDCGTTPVFQAGNSFEKSRVRGYFQDHETIGAVDRQLRELLQAGESWQGELPVWRLLAEQDWQESWKEHFHPIPVGEKLLILPSWLEPPAGMEGRLVVRMDPEMAFGSGQHETTQGCLAALERWASVGGLGAMLDLGTGSGILSIAALKLGASRVVATDLDPVAVETCLRNCQLNMGQQPNWQECVQVLQTSEVPVGQYHTIVANILASVLCDMAPIISQRLSLGGRVIIAGMLTSQAEEVVASYRQAGLVTGARSDLGDWTILELAKEQIL